VHVYWDGRDRAAERLKALVDAANQAGWRIHGTRLIELGDPRPEGDVAGAFVVFERGTTDDEAAEFLR
jgi:hypothetical protein